MSERRNKKETEQLFNMPEITRMEKKALSSAREKLEDSKLRKVLIWVFDAVSVRNHAGKLHGAYTGRWQPVFCK